MGRRQNKQLTIVCVAAHMGSWCHLYSLKLFNSYHQDSPGLSQAHVSGLVVSLDSNTLFSYFAVIRTVVLM